MKKIFTLFAVLLCTVMANAQTYEFYYKSGSKTYNNEDAKTFFTVEGSDKSDKNGTTATGTFILPGTQTSITTNKGLKLNSSGSIKFNLETSGTLTIYLSATISASNVPGLDGTAFTDEEIVNSDKMPAGFDNIRKIEKKLTAGSHVLSYAPQNKETCLFYIGVVLDEVMGEKLASPVITFDKSTGVVTIGAVANASKVVYTTDGSLPTEDSDVYTAPLTVSDGTTVKAVAIGDGNKYANSSAAEVEVLLEGLTCEAPAFAQFNGTFAISTPTYLGSCEYSLDNGSTWVKYTMPITVFNNTTVKARTTREKWTTSEIVDAEIAALPALQYTKTVYLGGGAFEIIKETTDKGGILKGLAEDNNNEAAGYSIEINVANKGWGTDKKINISEGVERTSYYGSNGAQNTITLPAGVKARRVTFYSFMPALGRPSGWNEVNGMTDTHYAEIPLLSQDPANPDIRVFDLDGVEGSFTFAQTGERPNFVMVLEIDDPEADPTDKRSEANLSWNVETTTLKVRDTFKAPVFVNPDNLPVKFDSSNKDVATVSEAGVITLVTGAIGDATISAVFEGDTQYKPATVSTTIKVETNVVEAYAWAEYPEVKSIPTDKLYISEDKDKKGSLDAGAKLIEDENITIETVYAAAFNGNYKGEYFGYNFPSSLQLGRVDKAPTAEILTGTEKEKNSPIIVTPKVDCKVIMFIRRQADDTDINTTESDDVANNVITRTHIIGMSPNDGKGVKASSHSNITTPIEQEVVLGEFLNPAAAKDNYLTGAMVWEMKKGETYTIWARGTTISMFGIGYYVPKVYDYTAKLKLGETLVNAKEGEVVEGTEVTVPYSRFVMEENGTVWQKDATDNQFAVTFEPNAYHYVKNIDYTKTDKKGIFFTEAENIADATKVTESFLSNGAGAYAAEPIQVTTLPAGEYRVSFGFMGETGSKFEVQAGDKVVHSAIAGEGDWEASKISANFTLNAESTPIKVVGATDAHHLLDYVLIAGRKSTADDKYYTLKFVDKDGNDIIPQEERSGVFGEEIVLGSDDKEPIFNDNNEKFIFVKHDEGKKINADEEKTVVNAYYRKADKYDYSVVAQLGESDDFVELTSGSNWEDEEVTVAYSRYKVADGKVYKKDATGSQYNFTFTLDENNIEEVLDYDETNIADVILFAEAENLEGVTKKESARCSNAKGAYAAGAIKVATLKPGTYTMIMGVSSFDDATFTVKAEGETLFTTACSNAWKEETKQFTLNYEADITVEGTALNHILDYVLLAGKELDPTAVDAVEVVGNGKWYTINGLELSEKPTVPGIYIHNGKKIVIR